jgi:sulfoxide reductase heme-binding subunit YedZ
MARPLRWLVPAAAAAGLSPLAKLAFDGVTGGLGPNPIAAALNRLGFWTLAFLTLTLAATPAHDWLGLSWPVRLRRTLGLLTFGYAALHLATYAGVDQFFDWAAIGADVGKRKFIAVGFGTFLLLVPLALTSTDRWVRRLGFRRWKALHRLVYAAATGGVVHFLWRVKIDRREPLLFAVALAFLVLLRLVPRRSRDRRPAPVAAAAGLGPRAPPGGRGPGSGDARKPPDGIQEPLQRHRLG